MSDDVLGENGGEVARSPGAGLEAPDDHGKLQIGHESPCRPGAKGRPGPWKTCLDGVGIVATGTGTDRAFFPPHWERFGVPGNFPYSRSDRPMQAQKGRLSVAKERVERDEEDLVRLYLTDIGQYPLLTKDDEVRLAQQIEAGQRCPR